MGMDVARPNFITKGRALSSVSSCRKTSCSSGWLRLVVQSVFAVITVASFILIVIMAVKNPHPRPVLKPTAPLRCNIQSCRVNCKEAPYFGKFEEDIIYTVMEADSQCKRVYLNLQQPSFTDGILPHTWLSRLRSHIHQISIIGGNLMHIPSNAFMAQFMGSVKSLVLQDVRIRTFESTSLVGLSSLRSFSILNSQIDGVQENALRAVDDTLESLTITESGGWYPNYFTGSRGFEQLTIVNFSYNSFYEILNNHSFVGLEVTKMLYLNFCRIKTIGEGTFDHLKSIEVLHLNNNMISTVPPGLFNTIVALDNPRPRINLQDNYWYCDCAVDDLIQLIRKELLLVDVKCTYPQQFSSMTFTQFEYACNNGTDAPFENNSSSVIDTSDSYKNQFYTDSVYVSGSYCEDRPRSELLTSPVQYNECSKKKLEHLNLSRFVDPDHERPANNRSKWLRFSYFIQTNLFSIIQVGARTEQQHYGLVWYQSTCPREIYCLDVIPYVLKLYDADPTASYIFCPFYMNNGSVENDDCIDVSVQKQLTYEDGTKTSRVVIYLTTMLLCSCFGAIAVYGLIRRKPTLLKGSKRILFVKHKNVEALVLPPKIPLRNDFIESKDKEVFTLTSGHNDKLKPPNVKRMKSVRSDKSGSPSYISAMQPTDDQLAEWRIKHHFNNDLTISSGKSELSTLSWIDATYYYSLDESDTTYESLK